MSRRTAEMMMILATLGWGASYWFMKLGLESIEAFNIIAMRFLIAFLLTSPLLILQRKKINRATLFYGGILGIFLFIIMSFILIALNTTDTSNAGFLVGLTVVFVPVLQIFITKSRPAKNILFSVGLAICGIALLTLKDSLSIGSGDLLCILSALIYATHIIITKKASDKVDTLSMGILQLGSAGLLGLVFSLIFETPGWPQSNASWFGVLALAIICSAFGFITQAVTQKYNTASRTGIIFSLEPIFAALFGIVLLNEAFGFREVIGAILVLSGIYFSGQNRPDPVPSTALIADIETK